MNKKLTFSFIIILIITGLIAGIFFGSKNKKDNNNKSLKNSNLVLFYGNTCPHCHDLEEWLTKNQLEKKIKIEKKEVSQDKENLKEMLAAAKTCQIKEDLLGVPFLFAEKKKCFLGNEEIISYLNKYLEKN